MAGRRQALEYVRFLVDRVPGYEEAALAALGDPDRRARDASGLRRLPADPRRRPRRAPVRRPGRAVRRAHRGPPRRRRHALAVPARRPGGGHPVPDAARARRGQRAGRGTLLLGHARRPRLGALDGPVHGDGPGGRHRRGAGASRPASTPRDVPAARAARPAAVGRCDPAATDARRASDDRGRGMPSEPCRGTWSVSTSAARASSRASSALDGTVERPTVDDTAASAFEASRAPVCASTYAAHLDAGGDGRLGLGVALPGIVEAGVRRRATCRARSSASRASPPRRSSRREFGVPVRCVNDGAAATLAEWRFGAARGHDDVVGLTLGTGRRQRRRRRLAGRSRRATSANGISVGHVTIQTGGRLCLCGNLGCAETLVSANAVVGRLRDALTRKVPSRRWPTTSRATRLDHVPRRSSTASGPATGSASRSSPSSCATSAPRSSPPSTPTTRGRRPRRRPDGRRATCSSPTSRPMSTGTRSSSRRAGSSSFVRAQLEDHAGVLGAAALVLSARRGRTPGR